MYVTLPIDIVWRGRALLMNRRSCGFFERLLYISLTTSLVAHFLWQEEFMKSTLHVRTRANLLDIRDLGIIIYWLQIELIFIFKMHFKSCYIPHGLL